MDNINAPHLDNKEIESNTSVRLSYILHHPVEIYNSAAVFENILSDKNISK